MYIYNLFIFFLNIIFNLFLKFHAVSNHTYLLLLKFK